MTPSRREAARASAAASPLASTLPEIPVSVSQVSVRDFRSAFVDPLALRQKEAIHLANTKFFDYLPKFCRDFLGVPVEVRKGGRVVFREGRERVGGEE
jgi:hypothetical protein